MQMFIIHIRKYYGKICRNFIIIISNAYLSDKIPYSQINVCSSSYIKIPYENKTNDASLLSVVFSWSLQHQLSLSVKDFVKTMNIVLRK